MSKIYTPEKMKEIGEKALPKGQVLYPPQILTQAFKKEGMPGDQIKGYIIALGKAAKERKIRIVQIGNTIFIVSTGDPGEAKFVPFTVEPNMMPMRVAMLPNTLKQMNYNKMTTIAADPKSSKLLDDSGLSFEKKRMVMEHEGKKGTVVHYELAI
jgi:hypothetical protein